MQAYRDFETNKPLLAGRFFGKPGEDRSVAGFHLTESIYGRHCEIPEHSHESAFFTYVVAGHSAEETRLGRYERVPSTLVFHPIKERHSNHWGSEGGSCLHVEISMTRLEAIQRGGLSLERPAILRGGSGTQLGARLHTEFRRTDTASTLAIEGIVLEILSEIARAPLAGSRGKVPLWLPKAKEILEKKYSEEIGVCKLASELGVSPSHLAVSFRDAYGETMGEFVRRKRVSEAREKLLSEGTSLGQIALECGFADQSHFSRVFRSLTGESPSQFRRNRRNSGSTRAKSAFR